MRQAVHSPKTLLEGQAAFKRTHHQLRPRFPVRAVLDHALQMADDPPCPVECDGVGRRVEARREEGLDAVRERVHANRGCGAAAAWASSRDRRWLAWE